MIGSKHTNCRHMRRQTWHDWVSWQSQILQSCCKLHQIKTYKYKGLHVWMPWAATIISLGTLPTFWRIAWRKLSLGIMLRHNFHPLQEEGARGNCRITGAQTSYQGFHLLEDHCKRCVGDQRLEHFGLDGAFFKTSSSAITCAQNEQRVWW